MKIFDKMVRQQGFDKGYEYGMEKAVEKIQSLEDELEQSNIRNNGLLYQLKKYKKPAVDLSQGRVTLESLSDLESHEKAGIEFLVKTEQYKFLRRWLLRQAASLYDLSGTGNVTTETDCYVLSRMAKFIVDTVGDLDNIRPDVAESENYDPYDMTEPEEESALPLPEADED